VSKVVVVGGGAAGMIAAGTAGKFDNEVILIEKNKKLGKKLKITGKGRCNLTNNEDIDLFIEKIINNKYSCSIKREAQIELLFSIVIY
jgi:hypothetical protein